MRRALVALCLLALAAPSRAEVNPAFVWPTLFQLGPSYREGDPHVSGHYGAQVLAVRKDTPSALAGADGDYSPFLTDASGRLWTIAAQSGTWTVAGSGTFTVGGTVAATQSGTWTVQPGNTANTTPWLFKIHDGTDAADVTAAGRLAVDGSGVTQPVSGTITANAGSGTFRIDEAAASGGVVSRQNLDLDTGAGTQNREAIGIALAASGGSVALEGTAANGAEVDVTRVQGTVTVSGTVTANQGGTWNLNNVSGTVSLPTGAATLAEQQTQTTALQKIDNIAHAGSDVALSEHVPISGQLDDVSPTTVTENQVAPIRITSGRALHVAQQGTVTVSGTVTANAGSGTFTVGDGSGPLTVDGTVTSNQGGAPWSVAGPAADGAAVSGNPVRIAGKDGSGNTQDIVTDSAGELQVDVLTLPNVAQSTASNLKTEVWGAAKGSTAAAGITVHSIDANTNGFAIIPAAALVAGNNNIGDVDIASFPDNEPFNVAQIAGTTTSTGLGIADAGTIRVSQSQEATYSAGTTAKTATAAGTGPFFTICGSSTKTVRIQRFSVSGTVATAAVYGDVVLKRTSTATSAGTATALTKLPYDSNSAASTANAVNYYTALATAGTSQGVIITATQFFPVTGTVALMPPPLIFTWRDIDSEAPTLRGTAQCMEANFGTTTTNAPTLAVSVAWTEK